MGRKANPVVKENAVEDSAALERGVTTLIGTVENAVQVADMLGYDLPYNLERVVQEARFYMGQSAEAMLEAGKRLILLKENEPFGEFEHIVESRLGIPTRTAQRMMSASLKYLSPALLSKAPALALLGKTKLFELMELDESELSDLVDGGSISGMKLDDIDRMTSRELKAALREQRETSKAKDDLLMSKNKKIDTLESHLSRKKNDTPVDEWEWAPTRRDLFEVCKDLSTKIQTELRRVLMAIQNQADASNVMVPEDMTLIQSQALSTLMQSLVTVQLEFDVQADLHSIVTPPWTVDFKPAAPASKVKQ